MSFTPYISHIAVILVALALALFVYMRSLRTKAKFDLYKVRDEFVYLVANGTLDEDGKVFQYYYPKINKMLQDAPMVGIDDLLYATFNHFNNMAEFRQSVDKARKKFDEFRKDPAFREGAVQQAASSYYSALQLMVLSHSSFTRAAYIVSSRFAASKIASPNTKLAQRLAAAALAICVILPQAVQRGLGTIRFAEEVQSKAPHRTGVVS